MLQILLLLKVSISVSILFAQMILWVCYSDVEHRGEIFQAVSDTGHIHEKNGKMVLKSGVYLMCNALTVYGIRVVFIYDVHGIICYAKYTCYDTDKSTGLCALPSSLPFFHLPFVCAQGLSLIKKSVCRLCN